MVVDHIDTERGSLKLDFLIHCTTRATLYRYYSGFTRPWVHSMAFHSARVSAPIALNAGYCSFTTHRSPFAIYASSIFPLGVELAGIGDCDHFNPFASTYSFCDAMMTSLFINCANEFVCPL